MCVCVCEFEADFFAQRSMNYNAIKLDFFEVIFIVIGVAVVVAVEAVLLIQML